MKIQLAKNFKKILSVCVSLNIFTSCVVGTPVNAHIDSDDELAIYDNRENDLIAALYDTIDNLHIPLNSTGVSLNVVIPSCLINVAHETFHAQEPDDDTQEPDDEAQKYERAQRCTSYFPIILKALCDKDFERGNPFNIFRIISIASILCILYDAGYAHLAGHMIYILSCFKSRSAMLDRLISDDDETWKFVSWHICYYNADSLLSTARELCEFEF